MYTVFDDKVSIKNTKPRGYRMSPNYDELLMEPRVT
jgi:hypothetical protein